MPIEGQLQVADIAPDWTGFSVQVLQDDRLIAGPVDVNKHGQFRIELARNIDKRAPIIIEAFDGPYRLKALIENNKPVISSQSTIALALATDPINNALISQETYKAAADNPLFEPIHTALYALWIHRFSNTYQSDKKPALLKFYPDSWQLSLSLAHSPKHLVGYQIKHHDALAKSYAHLHKTWPDVLQNEGALNPELRFMLRLDEQGKPLRWQYQSFQEQAWACVDYFEKGERRGDVINGKWPLGTRLFAVDSKLDHELTQSAIANILDDYNQQQRCQHQGWSLPNRVELLSLANRATGELDFPLSLPMNHSGNFWVTNEKGEIENLNLKTGLSEIKDTAQLLALSFTKDAPAPTKARETSPYDLTQLRNLYQKTPQQWPKPTVDQGVKWQELGPLPAMPFPEDNPYSEAKVALGQALFFDEQLSAKRNTACVSCHLPEQHWSDTRAQSPGSLGQNGVRNAMPIINTGYNPQQFWDGRATTLEDQSLHPIVDQLEMALTLDELLTRLQENPNYPALFQAAFGDSSISLVRFQQAIATFQRSLISQPAALDRFILGDHQALTDKQIHGLHLYRTKARCMNCHSGPLLTDFTFRNTGLTYYGRSLEDLARFGINHERHELGAFRVPSLRDVSFTAPYMHNGVFRALAGVLVMYNAGMTKGRNANYPQYQHKYDPFFPVVDDLIEPLGMSNEELQALADFLTSVSAPARTQAASEAVLLNPASEVLMNKDNKQ